ncbi:hypothetical protein RFM41_32535 [Mesorhizobium sp. VK25A]|uniref:Acyl-homoserine-lactone synthase n=1 Tax=Mesorhizobium vachelliae TaxID=3072309 RepID=A0ABU5AEM0_9HYPH|nr:MULTISPECIES: hypothetical protein [unclassified Mesorhizobium]MDX8535733.1 hypothetical protein [Mesorhizobium sp. VK25D]MDX8548486.1 hypothetical protein [Mesorhizobium sp. VK25A]
MLQLIAPEWNGDFADELHAMRRLRHHVFKQRLDWEVSWTIRKSGRQIEPPSKNYSLGN